MISRGLSDFLNYARFTAAFLVVLGHVRSFLYPPFAEYPFHTTLSRTFYFVTGFGHEAVMVFFVISGFLVGGRVLYGYQHGSFRWRRYFLDRASRLYIVLVPALIFGLIVDSFGLHNFGFPLYTQGQDLGIAVVSKNIEQSISVEIFFGNLFMLQTIFFSTFGSNAPLWSLANEFWYYLLFPVLLSSFYSRGFKRLVYATIAFIMFYFLPLPMLCLFGVWLLGVPLSYCSRFKVPIYLGIFIFTFVFVAVRFDLFANLSVPYLNEYLIGAGFFFFLLAFSKIDRPLLFSKIMKHLADFSYSLYLTHFPVLILVAAVLNSHKIGAMHPPNSLTAVFFASLTFGLILFSYLFSLATERHTSQLRALLHAGAEWFLIKSGRPKV